MNIIVIIIPTNFDTNFFYSVHGLITQGIPSLFMPENFFTYLMTPIDSTNNQNTMRRVFQD